MGLGCKSAGLLLSLFLRAFVCWVLGVVWYTLLSFYHKLLTVSPHASQMTVIGVHNYLVLFNLIFQSTGNVFYSHA